MNLRTLIERASTRFQDPGRRIYGTGEWMDYVNDAYEQVLAARPFWPFLETEDLSAVTASGSHAIALPTDVFKVQSVVNVTSGQVLDALTNPSDGRRHYPERATSLGDPQHYRVFSNTLELFPTPDGAYALDIDYWVSPGRMTPTDEPVFPSAYHRILVDGALHLAYLDDGNERQAAMLESRFQQGIASLADEMFSTRNDTYPTISMEY